MKHPRRQPAAERHAAAAADDEPLLLSIGMPVADGAAGPRPVAPRDVLAAVVAEVRGRRDGRLPMPLIEFDVPAAHVVHADPAVLGRILTMLVDNAVQSASQAVARGRPPVREVVVTSVESADAIEIEVADSGPDGADASVAVARSAQAAALGTLVRRLGGTLHAINCPEGGTAYTLRLPRRRPLSAAA